MPASRIIILGGGAAGMSCALWLKNLGFSPLIVESSGELGGQLVKIDRVNRWVLGIPGLTGPQLAKRYADHIAEEGIAVYLNTRLISIMQEDTGFRLVLAEAEKPTLTLSARALVIATGLRLKSSEMWRAIPSAKPLYQAGLLSFFPLDHLADTALAGQRVAVIGGGDNAHFTAKDLASSAAIVHLIIRSKPKAQPKVREAIEALIGQGILREYVGATIGKLEQQPGGIVIDLTRNDGKLEQIEVDRIFARTGFAPNTDDLAALGPLAGLAIDAAGYVQVDAGKRTSLPAVYAIGDVANPDHPAIVTAIADGAVAARAIALDFGA